MTLNEALDGIEKLDRTWTTDPVIRCEMTGVCPLMALAYERGWEGRVEPGKTITGTIAAFLGLSQTDALHLMNAADGWSETEPERRIRNRLLGEK